ncbi:MAG: MCE family protein [Aeromicrobium sp.]
MNQAVLGFIGLLVVSVLMVGALSIGKVNSALAGGSYRAELSDSGGLRPGDDVRVAGMNVGTVDSVKLDGTTVWASFTASDVTLGILTSAAVKSENALGSKYLAIKPSGSGTLNTIPKSRTDPGIAAPEALGSLTTTVEGIDEKRLARSLNSLSDVLEQTPEEFRGAVAGVGQLSRTIGTRDASLSELLQRSASVSGLLADRNEELTSLMGSGGKLFKALAERERVIDDLLLNIAAATEELRGLAKDNATTLHPAMIELQKTADLLNKYRGSLDFGAKNLDAFIRGLGEAVGSGPFFQAFVQNITQPENLMPTLDQILTGQVS